MKTLTCERVRRWAAAWVCLALAWGGTVARGQEGLGDVVTTVGTTIQDSARQDWAYLVWQASSTSLLTGRVFAVYAKPGEVGGSGSYVRQAMVQLQTDPRVIEPLLRRSEHVGQDLVRLQSDLEGLFGPLLPTNTIDRAVRLSAVIRGSLANPDHFQNLVMLARNHPGVSLCLGNAFAGLMIPKQTYTTFEVRVLDSTTEQDLAVIGRVTVQAGAPTCLPQPGTPVVVPDISPKGDLNVKLRWSTPDDLRRLSLMQFGFNLYRVRSDYAEFRGYDRPGAPLSSLTNELVTVPHLVKQVNRLPILPRKLFTDTEAAAVAPPGDTNTYFIADDDGRFLTNYVNYGFTNGATYHYFVAARDVLGRPGFPSPGLKVTVCDRMPPPPPSQVRVFNDYTNDTLLHTQRQALRVVWNQVTNYNVVQVTNCNAIWPPNAPPSSLVSNRSETVVNYWIYRWSSLTQMNAHAGELNGTNLLAVVPHLPGALTQSYLDDGAGSPHAPDDWSKTCWYTVRAGDAGACGQNISAHSGPGYGVLRDRVGPEAPSAHVLINCAHPLASYQGAVTKSGNPDTNQYAFHLLCQRLHPQIEWAEFYLYAPATGAVLLRRAFFSPGAETADLWYYQSDPAIHPVFHCRVGASDGKISDFAKSPSLIPPENRRSLVEVSFGATVVAEQHSVGAAGDDCQTHAPTDPGTHLFVPIVIRFFPAPTSREYRVYRRVDDGPLSLLCQGLLTTVLSWQTCTNDVLPLNPATLCYYVQTLDEHGNPSPLTNVACFTMAGRTAPPVPRLAPVIPQGDSAQPQLKLVWFCPPYGVDRFLVWVGDRGRNPELSRAFSPSLTFSNYPVPEFRFTDQGQPTNAPFYVFSTPRVGPGFGNGDTFSVTVNAQIGRTYVFFIRALGTDGQAGQPSNLEKAQWTETNVSGDVPWPARPFVETNGDFATFGAFLDPQHTNDQYRSAQPGNAVWLGAADLPGTQLLTNLEGQVHFRGFYSLNEFVLTNASNQRLLPAALYRYQVPTANYPKVSGDVVQVSPLLEEIAYGTNATGTILLDPFIDVTGFANPTNLSRTWVQLWLRDTQPQVSGAAYRYLLVRFNSNREIDQIIPTPPVEVP